MKKLEIITKEISQTRLTVAKDRITIKFANKEDEKYKDFLLWVAEQLKDTEFTRRGRLTEIEKKIYMLNDKGKKGIMFKYEDYIKI